VAVSDLGEEPAVLDEVNGLPTHILLVHAVVVLLPLCAVLLVGAAVLPSIRARLGVALPVLALACVVLVPLTTRAGKNLERRIGGGGPLVERHEHFGEGVLRWAVGVAVLSLAVWWLGHRERQVPVDRPVAGNRFMTRTAGGIQTALALRVVLALLCAVVAVGTVVQVVRTGESGSKAVWQGVGQS
jgi:hypothetical protein